MGEQVLLIAQYRMNPELLENAQFQLENGVYDQCCDEKEDIKNLHGLLLDAIDGDVHNVSHFLECVTNAANSNTGLTREEPAMSVVCMSHDKILAEFKRIDKCMKENGGNATDSDVEAFKIAHKKMTDNILALCKLLYDSIRPPFRFEMETACAKYHQLMEDYHKAEAEAEAAEMDMDEEAAAKKAAAAAKTKRDMVLNKRMLDILVPHINGGVPQKIVYDLTFILHLANILHRYYLTECPYLTKAGNAAGELERVIFKQITDMMRLVVPYIYLLLKVNGAFDIKKKADAFNALDVIERRAIQVLNKTLCGLGKMADTFATLAQVELSVQIREQSEETFQHLLDGIDTAQDNESALSAANGSALSAPAPVRMVMRSGGELTPLGTNKGKDPKAWPRQFLGLEALTTNPKLLEAMSQHVDNNVKEQNRNDFDKDVIALFEEFENLEGILRELIELIDLIYTQVEQDQRKNKKCETSTADDAAATVDVDEAKEDATMGDFGYGQYLAATQIETVLKLLQDASEDMQSEILDWLEEQVDPSQLDVDIPVELLDRLKALLWGLYGVLCDDDDGKAFSAKMVELEDLIYHLEGNKEDDFVGAMDEDGDEGVAATQIDAVSVLWKQASKNTQSKILDQLEEAVDPNGENEDCHDTPKEHLQARLWDLFDGSLSAFSAKMGALENEIRRLEVENALPDAIDRFGSDFVKAHLCGLAREVGFCDDVEHIRDIIRVIVFKIPNGSAAVVRMLEGIATMEVGFEEEHNIRAMAENTEERLSKKPRVEGD